MRKLTQTNLKFKDYYEEPEPMTAGDWEEWLNLSMESRNNGI